MAVVAIDWDNTLVFGQEWFEGSKALISELRSNGHKVIIHSCNNPNWIEHQLAEGGVKVDKVWRSEGKPIADLYIDDKGYHHPSNAPWDAEEIGRVFDRIRGLDNRKW